MVAMNQEWILLAVKMNISIDGNTTYDFVYFFLLKSSEHKY